ncbi:MAG: formyltransferase family protein, partial [Leptospiraceae bacterium]|nr:formyltransferase family protein [Leptospiraceae bacterium]
MKKKIVVLASGRGTNFSALIPYIKRKKLNAEIIALVSDNPTAGALLIADANKIRALCIPYRKDEKEIFHEKLLQTLENLEPDLIVAAG